MRVVDEQAPSMTPTRALEGLPQDAFVFAHFNTLRKVTFLPINDAQHVMCLDTIAL